MAATIRTVGHGTRSPDELSSLLQRAGVTTLIDVRRYPIGRRQPHLSRERLTVDLRAAGVGYEWWGEALGGRRAANKSVLAAAGWFRVGLLPYAERSAQRRTSVLKPK